MADKIVNFKPSLTQPTSSELKLLDAFIGTHELRTSQVTLTHPAALKARSLSAVWTEDVLTPAAAAATPMEVAPIEAMSVTGVPATANLGPLSV